MTFIASTLGARDCILRAFLFILILGIPADDAYAALSQWHPLNEVSADGGTTSIATTAGDKINATNLGGAITVLPSGNVGIGITMPAAPLHVKGAGTGAHLLIETDAAGQGDIWWQRGANPVAAIQISPDLEFWTNSGGVWYNRMAINQATGSVGIGGITPGSALDVSGALSVRNMAAPALSPAGQGRIYFDNAAGKFKVSENGGAYVDLLGAVAGGPWTENSTGNTVYVTNTARRIGIGTTAPSSSYKLTVSGGNGLNVLGGSVQIGSTGVSVSDPEIRLAGSNTRVTTSFTSGIWRNASAGSTMFSSGSSIPLVLADSGNVGIGTWTPAAKLDVQGGDLDAPALTRDNCYWSGWGCGQMTCTDGYFVAGIDFNAAKSEGCWGVGDDYDEPQRQIYCCQL